MTVYRYRAARPDGALVQGTLDAASADQAGTAVTELGLFPLVLAPVAAGDTEKLAASRPDLAIVFRSVAALVSAGVPLERALAASEPLARVRQALAYPLLLGVVGTASVLVIGTVIVPRFAELLGDMGQDLPVATQLLLTGSALVSRFWFLLLPLALASVWLVLEAVKRPASRRWIDETLITVPGLGSIRQALATTRVVRALGGMLRAGMPLLPALQGAREAAGDVAVAARLDRARERIAQGAPLTAELEREGALLASALQLFAVGESSGRLGEMALRAGDLAAQEAERGLKTLVTLVEPALIIAFGGMVAFVAAALLQAVYAIRPGGF